MPDVLIIPENVSLQLYAYGAPYRELRLGVVGSSSAVINTYPLAFSVMALNDTTPETRAAKHDAILAALAHGDIIMIPWIETAYAKSLYQEVGLM